MVQVTDKEVSSSARSTLPSRAGDTLPDGSTVDEVIQITANVGVYITAGGNKLTWVFAEECSVDSGRSIAIAVDLLTQLTGLALRKRTHRRGLKIIGSSLHDALANRIPNDQCDHFATAREFMNTRLRERLQIWYLAMTCVTTFLAIIILGGVYISFNEARLYALAGVMGAIGAFVSVAQRFRSIQIERHDSYTYTALGGASRIIFGGIFGGILLLMQKAGLVLALAEARPSLLALACFLAGFSERLMPELLAQFESGLSQPQRKPAAPRT